MLERLLPEAIIVQSDHVDVAASPAEAYAAARSMDTQAMPLARFLFGLRELLGGHKPARGPATIDRFTGPGQGFFLLEDVPGSRFIVASVGRFWKLNIEWARVSPADFAAFREQGWGKLAWGMLFQPLGEAGTRITLELRVVMNDAESLKRFRRYYWWWVGPFSHLLRRMLLRGLRRQLGSLEDREKRGPLPGDELVPNPKGQVTYGITIDAPPEAIWPWLVQMGCRRAGWYSYDRLDNAGIPSADRIIPELQHLKVGDVLPATPKSDEGFRVARLEPPRALVLSGFFDLSTGRDLPPGSPPPERYFRTSWAFVLEPLGPGQTRLHVRNRGDFAPRWFALFAAVRLLEHHLMERKQLRTLKQRAEGRPLAWRPAPGPGAPTFPGIGAAASP